MESKSSFAVGGFRLAAILAERGCFCFAEFLRGVPFAMLEADGGGLAVVAFDAGGGVRAAIRPRGERNGWSKTRFLRLVEGFCGRCQNEELASTNFAIAPRWLNRFGWDCQMVHALTNGCSRRRWERPIPPAPRV